MSLALWLYILGALALTLALIFLFLFFSNSNNLRDKKVSNSPRHSRRKKNPRKPGKKPRRPTETPKEQLPGLLKSYSQEAPSPEAGPTKIDAIFIDLIRQATELPSAVLELSSLLREPDVPVRKIAEAVETDPVLSARILRVVNSAGLGRGKINSLHQAIVYLGFNQTWLLVNQMLTARSMKPLANLDPIIMRTLWIHAAVTSTCAKYLLLKLGFMYSPIGPTVMTCALMHDVGKFLLRGLGPFQKDKLEDETGQTPPEHVLFSENKQYGINHCRVGYLLSTYWNLPEQICTTIAYHHHASFSNWQDIPIHVKRHVALVALSDILANLAGYSEGESIAWDLHPDFAKELNLKVNVSSLLTRELKRDLKNTEKLINAGGGA